MQKHIPVTDFEILKKSLPSTLQNYLETNDITLGRFYPLFSLICSDREVIDRLRASFNIPKPLLSNEKINSDLAKLTEELLTTTLDQTCKYRLPLVIGEYPLHTRAINTAIKKFNTDIENYYLDNIPISPKTFQENYKKIIEEINVHAASCDNDSIWQVARLMASYSRDSFMELAKKYPLLLYTPSEVLEESQEAKQQIKPAEIKPIDIKPIGVRPQPNKPTDDKPFVANYNYNFNHAGRLSSETDTLLLNAFGMKIGGHFDAQVKYPPRFFPINQLHATIFRQLSHRMIVPQNIYFKEWIEKSLSDLGVIFKIYNENDVFVNPFLSKPISFFNPVKINETLSRNLTAQEKNVADELKLSLADVKIVSQYLSELLTSFRDIPGQGLGIGANWDGTVNLSNEDGAYAFKFKENQADWGKAFRQLSLHRQGPAEVSMNAAKGIKYEGLSLLTSFDYMSQLQPSEYNEVIYSALIDNVVAALFPEPAYFENSQYKKFRKFQVINQEEKGTLQVNEFYQACNTGTFFKDKSGKFKQTPMYRRSGTLEVQAFPRNTGYSEDSRASYAGNPLAALQIQYLQSLHGSTRGNIAYNPIGPDKFIPDMFYGQVIQNDCGDLFPYIGVVPKNFDKHFKLPNELCASFVIRMLQSSRIMQYCPTFKNVVLDIKKEFLPSLDSTPPALPTHIFNKHLKSLHTEFSISINKQINYEICEKSFYALFKNIMHSLYQIGKYDESFQNAYSYITNNSEILSTVTRASCEQIIRYLKVNKPITIPADKLEYYTNSINYLSNLVAYFYPQPSDEMAVLIAKAVKPYVLPLLKTAEIHDYFVEMKRFQQTNLSRKQTPGMAFSALKDGGPSESIVHDYHLMHTRNFLSGYRDPEGNQLGEPEFYERVLDFFAKVLGASLQLMQRYNLFAVIRRPFAEGYIQGKKFSNEHPRSKLWVAAGGIKGFVWDGLAIGSWQTITTPFLMLYDLIDYLAFRHKEKKLSNALAISAAPANEPSQKVKTTIQVRDLMLQLIKNNHNKDQDFLLQKGKDSIFDFADNLIKVLYPSLSETQAKLCQQKLLNTFPLADSEWVALFNVFNGINHASIRTTLEKYKHCINRDFCFAVFKILIDPSLSHHYKTIIKNTQKFYRLNSIQATALKDIVKFYFAKGPAERLEFLTLFQFDGPIQQILHARDQKLQKLQNWIIKLFSDEWMLEILSINELNQRADTLGVKDKAQNLWANFADREFQHGLLSKEESKEIFNDILSYLKKSSRLINKFEFLQLRYRLLRANASNLNINNFYNIANELLSQLSDEAQILLRNLIDVTMNAVVNRRLDTINIFEENKNPLLSCTSIESWLRSVHENNRDLRSLLEQQVQQSPSLDHALWRDKCILQVLEKHNPAERIRKTGMQSLLRFWSQHKENVTRSGEAYIDPKSYLPQKIVNTNLFFKDSTTLQYAAERVSHKVPCLRK